MSATEDPVPSIDICVCTFRRPQLLDTLRSIAGARLPHGYTVGIVVADNDETPSARALVSDFAATTRLKVRYIAAPARNISIARNACLDASAADYLAFVDDDETVTAEWLAAMIEALRRERADAAVGPVRASYGAAAPGWMRKGDFHSTYPVFRAGRVSAGYTCNVLMRMRSTRVDGLRFDLARGQTGGEDTDFFGRIVAAGGRLAYAPDAWVEETVPDDRASFTWLAKRRFRVGQTHARLQAGQAGIAGRARAVGVAGLKIAYCVAVAIAAAPMPVRRNRSLLRGIMHAGAVSALLGQRELRLYGAAEPAGARPAGAG